MISVFLNKNTFVLASIFLLGIVQVFSSSGRYIKGTCSYQALGTKCHDK